MAYLDGFVIPLPKRNMKAYLKMARQGLRMWKRHGALDYKECVLHDLKPMGMTSLFPRMARLKKGETIVFAYILFRSKAQRDRINKKVMQEMTGDPSAAPFDLKRFAYAGFKVAVG